MIRTINPICEWAEVHGLPLGDIHVVPGGGLATHSYAPCPEAPAKGMSED